MLSANHYKRKKEYKYIFILGYMNRLIYESIIFLNMRFFSATFYILVIFGFSESLFNFNSMPSFINTLANNNSLSTWIFNNVPFANHLMTKDGTPMICCRAKDFKCCCMDNNNNIIVAGGRRCASQICPFEFDFKRCIDFHGCFYGFRCL